MMEPDALEAAADTALGARYCAPPPPATDPAAKQPHLAGGKIWSKRGIDVASIHACVWRLATERRAPDASAASTEAAFVWAQNGIMLQEIERLRLQNAEQARQLEALESAAQDVSSEAQLALLVAQNRTEQQRIQLLQAKELLDKKEDENKRLKSELETAIHAIHNRHAKICGQGDVGACELQRLRMEVQALRCALEAENMNKSGSRAYEHESHSESFESSSGAENHLSSFLRRAKEKRKIFNVKFASCDIRGSPHNLKEQPEYQQTTSTEGPRNTAPGRADNTYIQREAPGRGFSPRLLDGKGSSPTLLEVSVLVQDLVAVCKAHKCEAEVIMQELSAQRARYNDVLQELAEYKQRSGVVFEDSLRRALPNVRAPSTYLTSAVKEKEGLWEVQQQLLPKLAALQARRREADDSTSRLQENVECVVLKDKLQSAKTEQEELMHGLEGGGDDLGEIRHASSADSSSASTEGGSLLVATNLVRADMAHTVDAVMGNTTKEKFHPETASTILTLDMNIAAVGKEGSAKRAVFNIKLAEDLAKASGIKESSFMITRVTAGGVVVDIDIQKNLDEGGHDPFAISRELERQAMDPKSVLRSGALTGKLASLQLHSQLPAGSAECSNPLTFSNSDLSYSSAEAVTGILHASSRAGPTDLTPQTAPDEVKETVTMLQLKLAAKEAELSNEIMQGQYAVEEALSALQQRLEAKYAHLFWRQMQAHEQAVKSLLARLRGDN